MSGLHTTYNELTEPDGPGSLESFLALDPQGNWRLKVINSGNKNGTLENWTLHLKGESALRLQPGLLRRGHPLPGR